MVQLKSLLGLILFNDLNKLQWSFILGLADREFLMVCLTSGHR